MATSKSTRALWSCKNAGTRGQSQIPITSMYGIFTYTFTKKHQPNVGKYTVRPMDPMGICPQSLHYPFTDCPWLTRTACHCLKFHHLRKKTQALDFLAYC